MALHYFTPEEKKFIEDHVKDRSNNELTDIFNTYFGLDLNVKQIKAFKKNHKLSSGLDGRFQPGQIPFNKGKKGIGGWEPTQFKKGNKPVNYRPVGSERVNVDGYVEIKTADPNKWRLKHQVIWEQVNGPIPKGYAVIFGDSNRLNLEPENLILVSRKQLVRLNQNNLISNNAELTKTGIIIADIFNKIGERKKNK